jgi:hypothetical protein
VRAGLVALAALLSICSLAGADTLADVRASGELVWGADQEGGVPTSILGTTIQGRSQASRWSSPRGSPDRSG